ncbi:MAG: hypothetical protein AB7O65_08095 [Candidatus Korobacteraceae bacterium]
MSEIEGTDGPAGLPAAQRGRVLIVGGAILKELKSRRCFRQEFDMMDPDDENEIRLTLGDAALTASGLEEENRRLREALTEISAFTADVPADEPLSHVHGVASAAIRSLKSPPANTEEGV